MTSIIQGVGDTPEVGSRFRRFDVIMGAMNAIPDFTPHLDDRARAEFLALSLELLPYSLRQPDSMLDAWAWRFERPEPPRDPDLPLLPPKAYPRPDAALVELALRSLIPPPVGEGIVGRKAELDQAVLPLLGGHPVVIGGRGGSGKTTLLRQIAHDPRVRKTFRHVWWLDDPDRAGETLGLAFNAPGVLRATTAEQPRYLREFLNDNLLLIDDVADADTLGWVLSLTPHIAVVSNVKPTLRLGGLPVDSAVTLLVQRTDQAPNLLRSLVESVDGLPAAINLLGALMAEDGIAPGPIADFLASAGGDSLAALYRASYDALPEPYQALCRTFAASPRRWIAIETVLERYPNPLVGQRTVTFIERRGFVERRDGLIRVAGDWPALIPAAETGFMPIPRPADSAIESAGSARGRERHESGLALMEEYRDEEAEAELTEALAIRRAEDTDHAVAETLTALGRLAYLRGDEAGAIHHLEAAAAKLHDLRDDQSLGVVRIALSRAYRRAGRLEAALSVLDESAPPDEFGAVYRARGEWDAAIEAYRAADKPHLLAESYLLAGRFAEALNVLAALNDFEANWLRAVIEHVQGHGRSALTLYTRLVDDVTPDWRATLARARARAMASLGDVQGAALLVGAEGIWYEERLPRPVFARARLSHALYAHLCRAVGRLEEAEAAARQAIDLSGERPNPTAEAIAHDTLARIAWSRGEIARAITEFDAELTALGNVQPRDEHQIGVVLHNVADLLRDRGETDRAIANYRRALTHKDPIRDRDGLALTRLALRDVLIATGRGAEALEVGNSAIEGLLQPPEADLHLLGHTMAQQARAQIDVGRVPRADAILNDWIARLEHRASEGLVHPYRGVQLLAIGLYLRSLPDTVASPLEVIDLAEKALSMAEAGATDVLSAWAARRDLGQVYLRFERWDEAREV
ncbi:MAG TPA: hypothetical protein VMT34_07110, partial [Aggregatilineales bacterium]|nr:hypothetical protein [Aggregatilineales bacterium]